MEAAPGSNFGGSFLRTEGGADPDAVSLLRFSVSGLSGSVTRATLRVSSIGDTVDGPAAYAAPNTWSESSVTWSSRPVWGAVAFGDVGVVPPGGVWLEYDVTAAVTGEGSFSFALAQTHEDALDIHARESSSVDRRPQLVVVTG